MPRPTRLDVMLCIGLGFIVSGLGILLLIPFV